MGFRHVFAVAYLLTGVAPSTVSAQEAQREPAAPEPDSKTQAGAKRLEAARK